MLPRSTKFKDPEVVAIHHAKTHLSRLLARVEQGEIIIIKKGNRPVAQLGPLPKTKDELRPLGMDRGTVKPAKDFDEMPVKWLGYFKK